VKALGGDDQIGVGVREPCLLGARDLVAHARVRLGVVDLLVAGIETDDLREVRGEGDRRLAIASADVDREALPGTDVGQPGEQGNGVGGPKARIVGGPGREQILPRHAGGEG
jgi:hypothetical protein